MKDILYQGENRDGIYVLLVALPPSSFAASTIRGSSFVSSSTNNTFDVLHARLGHASAATIRKIFSCALPKPPTTLCQACAISKIHKLPFPTSNYQATSRLDLICSDVWGLAPVISKDGFRYYVLFFDHFSKYTWIYFLKNKFDILDVFHQFWILVEKYFARSIKQFQADSGGEFQALTSNLRSHGIIQRISCPHTPEQNGYVERKHRHITETGRTLLHHTFVPTRFLD
jgi:hypothetical protein